MDDLFGRYDETEVIGALALYNGFETMANLMSMKALAHLTADMYVAKDRDDLSEGHRALAESVATITAKEMMSREISRMAPAVNPQAVLEKTHERILDAARLNGHKIDQF